MQRIHILRNAYIAAYAQALRHHGIDPVPLLRNIGIPQDFEYLPGFMMSARLLHQFILQAVENFPPALISSEAGFFNAGNQLNPFSETMHTAVNLLDAIQQHNRNVSLYSPGNRFQVELDSKAANWSKLNRSPLAETEAFCIANMIGHVRTFLGQNWRPAGIAVSVLSPSTLETLPHFTGLQITVDPYGTRLTIPIEQLRLPIYKINRARKTADPRDRGIWMNEPDFLHSLRLLMTSYVLVGNLTVRQIARAAGLSSRTLQRRLHMAGITFSRLVDQVRFQTATEMLLESEHRTITQISFELGYNDPGSFSRSFRRVAGIPPTEFRRRHLTRLENSAT